MRVYIKYLLFIGLFSFLFISCGEGEKTKDSNNKTTSGKTNSSIKKETPATNIKVEGQSVTVLCQCDNKSFVRGSGDDQNSAQENAKSKCSDKTASVKNCRSF